MASVRSISPTVARRLALTRQRLAGPRPSDDETGIVDVVRDIGCLQIDPMRIVAPSHFLVLWSRLGNYDITLSDVKQETTGVQYAFCGLDSRKPWEGYPAIGPKTSPN